MCDRLRFRYTALHNKPSGVVEVEAKVLDLLVHQEVPATVRHACTRPNLNRYSTVFENSRLNGLAENTRGRRLRATGVENVRPMVR